MRHEPIVLFGESFVNTSVQQPSIALEERGLQFGDGIYEVVRLYGGTFHLLEPHLTRLYRSMEEIELKPSFSKAQLVRWLYELVEKNEFREDGMVYLQISRGVQPRNHVYEPDIPPTLYAYVVKKARPLHALGHGIKACSEQDIRWLRCDIKSLNLLPNVMARTAAERKGCTEAIFVRNGIVTEGSHSNFFLVKHGALYTHPATHLILNGIVRQYVLSLAHTLDIPVHEDMFSLRDVQQADEGFFTSTTGEIMPMIQLDGSHIGNGKVGPITYMLQQAFSEGIANTRLHTI